MLNKIRTFSKTVSAKVLIAIIIIPFVFWGMGGLFSGGNLNNIAKINNKNISTQDFMDYVNRSNFTSEDILKVLFNISEFFNFLVTKILNVEELKPVDTEEYITEYFKKYREYQKWLVEYRKSTLDDYIEDEEKTSLNSQPVNYRSQNN